MKFRYMLCATIALSSAAMAKPALKARSSVEATIRSVFAPYANPKIVAPDHVNAPPWSQRTRALIKNWQDAQTRSTSTDVTPLSGGDWLCQCQDWDPKRFRIKTITRSNVALDRIIVDTRYMISEHANRRLKLVMIREHGQWQIDDLIFDGEQVTLAAQLREELTSR